MVRASKYELYFSKSSSRPVDEKVHYSGLEECLSRHKGVGIRNHFLLHYVLKNKGIVIHDKKRYSLTAGDAFLYYPEQRHYYRADQEEPWHYAWVGFSGQKVSSLLNEINFCQNGPVIFGEQRSVIENYFLQMRECFKSPSAGQDYRAEGLLYVILTEIANNRKMKVRPPEDTPTLEYYVRQTVEFIQTNYQSDINVSRISLHIGYNRSYFTTAFRTVMGVPLSQYLFTYRMKKAGELLTDTVYSIQEIAHSVGYEDYFTFTRAFKRHTGRSPTTYRRDYASRGYRYSRPSGPLNT